MQRNNKRNGGSHRFRGDRLARVWWLKAGNNRNNNDIITNEDDLY
jgi:hypothetical protein